MLPFLDREREMARLDGLLRRPDGAFAVVHGRRRLGKTRLLVEWSRRHGGAYHVADQSAAPIQRRYLAETLARRMPGFADVDYPDWPSLLGRLARDAAAARFRGPVVIDELPYLALASPELASVLQRFVDHQAPAARLVLVIAGSSQRMMQGMALSAEAPLYGRAVEILGLQPLSPTELALALRIASAAAVVEAWAAWGGVPRYWELAAEADGAAAGKIDQLVLDPLGALHHEPDRLLLEEIPSAIELRPVLDAIGAGAHRASEIAARVGRPATSLSRPLGRLVDLGLVRRDVPFGETERSSKRSLYGLADPFFRLWFRVVAPHRGELATAAATERRKLLARDWPHLAATAWEDLCRQRLGAVAPRSGLGRLGPWAEGRRWWHGNAPEWDLVARSADGRRLVLGEARWSARPCARRDLARAAAEVAARPAPPLTGAPASEVVRALFVPAAAAKIPAAAGVVVVTADDLLAPG